MAVGSDVDGNGSVLPNLVIKTVDPALIKPDDIQVEKNGSGSKVKLVQ